MTIQLDSQLAADYLRAKGWQAVKLGHYAPFIPEAWQHPRHNSGFTTTLQDALSIELMRTTRATGVSKALELGHYAPF